MAIFVFSNDRIHNFLVCQWLYPTRTRRKGACHWSVSVHELGRGRVEGVVDAWGRHEVGKGPC